MEKVKLIFKSESFYNNGQIVLNSMDDFSNHVHSAFEKELDVTESTRKEKGITRRGIKADSLNSALRKQLKLVEYPTGTSLFGETHVENGVFFNETKEGFDFSAYDEDYNFSVLRNQYIGDDGKHLGEEKLIALYKKKKEKKSAWTAKIKASGDLFKSIPEEKKSLTVVGEFQFGNWALVYRDLFRVMAADAAPGVGMYIYITATGTLQNLLSNNTVNYDQVKEILSENEKLIKVPTWLIGLDIE